MGVRLTSTAGRRAASWMLILALLPALTFFGHWPREVAIPGTGYYLAIPGSSAAPSDGSAAEGHDHTRHCHADAASCSDVPAAAGVSFAILNKSLAFLGVGGFLVLLALRWWVPGEGFTPSPEIQPPRAIAASC